MIKKVLIFCRCNVKSANIKTHVLFFFTFVTPFFPVGPKSSNNFLLVNRITKRTPRILQNAENANFETFQKKSENQLDLKKNQKLNFCTFDKQKNDYEHPKIFFYQLIPILFKDGCKPWSLFFTRNPVFPT